MHIYLLCVKKCYAFIVPQPQNRKEHFDFDLTCDVISGTPLREHLIQNTRTCRSYLAHSQGHLATRYTAPQQNTECRHKLLQQNTQVIAVKIGGYHTAGIQAAEAKLQAKHCRSILKYNVTAAVPDGIKDGSNCLFLKYSKMFHVSIINMYNQ